MKKIGIVGGGFSGTLTAVHLIEKTSTPFEMIFINEKGNFNRGIAYNPYSKKHILNVPTAKMSAYPADPNHFLDWVMALDAYKNLDRDLVGNAFMPRYLYGEYLVQIWGKTLKIAQEKGIKIIIEDSVVSELDTAHQIIHIVLENGKQFELDECVIATGNIVPRNPKIKNEDFYKSSKYFQNPWGADSVQNIDSNLPVLIVGNGLTMVDTVLGLLENGYKNKIYSISPNGFNILPHRHGGMKYDALSKELNENMSLRELVSLVNKHIKKVRRFGVSAEPLIDSFRPFTQKIWQNLSDSEKNLFMSRLRHLWGVARHRIPLHIHDKLQQLRIDNQLIIKSGKLLNIVENGDEVLVTFYDKKNHCEAEIKVSRVINCTGPETDLELAEKSFLKSALHKGLLAQDSLKLGIKADVKTFQMIDKAGNTHTNLYTLGSNLKGELWESTAVPELRGQAESLATQLIEKFK
jgi:uncharacterized NAD(P)/FAD-binding protein YdhS